MRRADNHSRRRWSAAAATAVLAALMLGPSASAGSFDRGAEVSAPAVRVSEMQDLTFTLAATGDVLPHSPLWSAAAAYGRERGTGAYDYRPMFEPLQPIIASADLAICHLETPIAPAGEPFSTFPYYGLQPELATALAATGYDRCSTASNHTYDRGPAGIDRTVDVLTANNIGQSGMAKYPGMLSPQIFLVNGVAVTHLSYTWSYNGVYVAPGDAWKSVLIDPARIVADARIARDLGAEVVIVSMHWGTEGVHAPSRYQRDVANAITAPGVIDLVIGHHAHVVQPIELINGTWVVFGLGNQISDMPVGGWVAATQDGAIVAADITRRRDGSVHVSVPRVYPTWVDRGARWTVRPVQSSINSGQFSGSVLAQLQASLRRTTAVMGLHVVPEP